MRIGSLGPMHLLPGRYLYVGSAMKSLEKRVERHLRPEKRRHWHIDYLTSSSKVKIGPTIFAFSTLRLECQLSSMLAGLSFTLAIPRFGSSDCRSGCESHFYLANAATGTILASISSVLRAMSLEPRVWSDDKSSGKIVQI